MNPGLDRWFLLVGAGAVLVAEHPPQTDDVLFGEVVLDRGARIVPDELVPHHAVELDVDGGLTRIQLAVDLEAPVHVLGLVVPGRLTYPEPRPGLAAFSGAAGKVRETGVVGLGIAAHVQGALVGIREVVAADPERLAAVVAVVMHLDGVVAAGAAADAVAIVEIIETLVHHVELVLAFAPADDDLGS